LVDKIPFPISVCAYVYAPLTVKTGYTLGCSPRFLGIENEIYFEMQL